MKKIIKHLGKFILLKCVYPNSYRKKANQPIEKGKVIFLEVRGSKIGNSMMQIFNMIKDSGKHTVKTHYLHETEGRILDNVKRTVAFLKDMGTAEYVFLSEANNCFACFDKRSDTKVVQLWHGCGAFKKFGLSTSDKNFGSSFKQQKKYPLYNNLDLVTVSSDEVAWAYIEAMGVKKDIVKPTGISRTDVFFDKKFVKSSGESVYAVTPEAKGKKIMLYAPTFRGNVADAKAPQLPDLKMLKEEFGEDYIFLIKQHPFVKNRPVIDEKLKDFAVDVTETLEIDELICVADVCISDYSSLVFEYALFERPMFFYAYDINDYNDWRGFYYDYESLTPGSVVKTTEELINEIKKTETYFDKAEVIEFKRKFMSSCDGHASERILQEIGIEI